MNNVLKLSLFLYVSLVFSSCSKDDPLPKPIAGFIADPGVVEVGVPVMFDNLTTNAASYEWDFGDGQTSTEISPTVTFTETGTMTVSLKAITQDNQTEEFIEEISVKQRVFTGYRVNIFPTTNGEENWDADSTGTEVFADVVVLLRPVEDTNTDEFLDGIYINRDTSPFGNSGNEMVLTSEMWELVLFDFEGDPDGMEQGEFTPISGIEFNPVEYGDVVKFESGDSGYIALFSQNDQTGQVLLDIDLFFELR